MAAIQIRNLLGLLVVGWITASGLMASEHHGVVRANGLPVPGATVTAVQGDKKLVTTTDDQGVYSFANLPDGVWTIEVDMLGFQAFKEDVGIAPDAPSPTWELKLLSAAGIQAAATAATTPAEPSKPTPAPSGTPATRPATAEAPKAPAAGKPATAANGSAPARPNGQGGRGAQGANGRPSLRQAMGQGGFQRMDVNASGDSSAANGAEPGMNGEMANGDLNQNANDAFVVNGSVSSGLNMPQQPDWFGLRAGMMGGPGFMGGNGLDMGPGSVGPGNGPGAAPGGMMAGPGGGGPGGGPGGFGGRGGGPGGFGGRGGFGGGPGGGGDRGGPGRGGPNMAAFGNGRRNRRMQYNGNAAFTLDNSVWDARSFSLTGQDTPKAAYAKARGTLMFGGPLKIPHVLSGRNTTFTFNYQMARTRSGSVATGLVPTDAMRAGDFSQALDQQGRPVTIYDPTTGQPFPNNQIPSARISPQAIGLLNYYPLPNFTSNARYNYQIPLVGTSNQDNVNVRISESINSKNQISGGFSYQRNHTFGPSANNIFNFADTSNMSGINTNVNWSYHFTTKVISNLRYQFTRSSTTATPYFANLTNVSGNLGITGNDQSPEFWGPPTLSFSSGFSQLSDGQTSLNRNQSSAVGDSLIWVHGTHNMTFGGDFRRQQVNPISQANARGTFGFTGTATSQSVNGAAVNRTGYDMADLLLGYVDTSAVAYGNADKYFRASWFDGYFTDDWRVNSQLSINAGLRWDYQAPVTESYNRLVNLDIAPGFTAAQYVLPGGTGPVTGQQYPLSLVHPDRHEFQPRVGIAWRPFPKKSTVIRAGYGLYYNTSVFQPIANQMAQQSPLSYSITQAASLANPLTLANGFATPSNLPVTNTFAIDPNFQIGYSHNWMLSIQQSLPHSLVATATYIGIKGTRGVQEFLPNSGAPGSAASGFPAGYIYETSNGNSTYQTAQFQMQRRFRSGLAGSVTYAYSHAIDDAALGGRGQAAAVLAQNWLDLDAERARSSFDQRHRLTATMQYSTGQGTQGGALLNGWKGTLLKNWTLLTNITLGSGLPETPSVSGNRSTASGTGITGVLRADYTGLPVYDAPGGQFINPLAFVAPPAGQWGTAGRDSFSGPAQFTLNGSVGRVIRLGERRSLDIRFDATNVLNHVTFLSWNSTVGSAQFGLPNAANAMRSMTAIVRFRF